MKYCFPDINVWVALAYRGHQHHPAAASWFNQLTETAGFCRVTQLGFLRLITHPTIMGDDVLSQKEAWKSYDKLAADSRVTFYFEPDELEDQLRLLTASSQSNAQQWPDAYLAAFARSADLTLVTFDRALAKLAAPNALLLH